MSAYKIILESKNTIINIFISTANNPFQANDLFSETASRGAPLKKLFLKI